MCKKLGYLGGLRFFWGMLRNDGRVALRVSSGASFSGIFSQKRFVCYDGIPMKLVVLTPHSAGKVAQWSLYHPFGGESNHTNGNFDGFPL